MASEFVRWSLCVLIFLYQVTKLIEESTVSKTVKNAIDTDKLLDWLVENSVLSIALEGKGCSTKPAFIQALGANPI